MAALSTNTTLTRGEFNDLVRRVASGSTFTRAGHVECLCPRCHLLVEVFPRAGVNMRKAVLEAFDVHVRYGGCDDELSGRGGAVAG